MISGDVLKYRNGFLIKGRYETRLTGSSRFPLTPPKDGLNEALLGYAAATFTDRAAKLEDFIGALQGIIDSSDVHPAADKIDILQKLIADGHGLIEELSGGAHDY